MILEALNERIIAALKDEQVPWAGHFGFPTNALTRQRYDGFASLVLNVASESKGFQSRYWATLSEWRSMGAEILRRPAHVGLGGWQTEILQSPAYELPRSVYNLDQIDGYLYTLRTDIPSVDYKAADKFVADTGAKIIYRKGDECYYWYPPNDCIVFPLRQQFERGLAGLAGYFHTMFHELVHWSSPRLKWDHDREAIRELRSEIGADFLCSVFGIPHMPVEPFRQTHLRLMERWIEMMREDSSLIVRTANDAAKAVDFLLSCRKKSAVIIS